MSSLKNKKNKNRRKKNGEKGGVASKVILSRKEKRKENRRKKKVGKKNFNESKSVSKVTQQEDEDILQQASASEEMKKVSFKEQEKPSEKKKSSWEKTAGKLRRRQLKSANEEEDKLISKLEKQLGYKKRREAQCKAYKEDGLDFLLQVCEPELYGGNTEFNKDTPDLQDEDSESNSDQEVSEQEESDDDQQQQDKEEEGLEVEDEEDDEEEFDDDDDGLDDITENLGESGDEQDIDETEEMEQDINEDEDMNEDNEETKEDKNENWEDIYGRKRDSQGNVLKEETASRYIPPALRNRAGNDTQRITRRLKGLLNRLAEANLQGIAVEVESMYGSHSRNDMNACLTTLLIESLIISPVLTPERLIIEHAVLIATLHANIGTEVGASILQTLVKKYDDHYSSVDLASEERKDLENYLLCLCHCYFFKVVDHALIFDLIDKSVENFSVKDIELILLILKTVGFNLRKDDPLRLKSTIIKIQSKSSQCVTDSSRIKFMLEILLAIKNNNIKKLPNYDPDYVNHLKKIMKSYLRPGASVDPLKISYTDFLQSENKGRWWIVGGAWKGHEDEVEDTKVLPSTSNENDELIELARKMRMNTSSRKKIFCLIMSSEDYIDAFEKLIKLNINNKEREIVFVILDCCLQEKSFNPYYSQVMNKLSQYDRKYRMACQFALWDKIKEVDALAKGQYKNLADFMSFLIIRGIFSVALLKTIEFCDINKIKVTFVKRILSFLCRHEDNDEFKKCFQAVVGYPKFKTFREGLILFIRHFILKKKNIDVKLINKYEQAEKILKSGDSKLAF